MRHFCLAFLGALVLTACSENEAAQNTSADMTDMAEMPAGTNQPTPTEFCDVINERVTVEECEDFRALTKDVKVGAAALNVPTPMTRDKKSQVTLVVDRRPLSVIRNLDAASGPPRPVDDDAAEQGSTDGAENAMVTEFEVEPAGSNTAVANAAGPDASADDPQPTTPLQDVGEIEGKDIPFQSGVSRYMEARLAGQGFDIRQIEPSEPTQEISPGGKGVWIWEVIPREGGLKTLSVQTWAVGIVNGRAKRFADGGTRKDVQVEVTVLGRARDFLTAVPDWAKLIAGALAAVGLVLAAWFKLAKTFRKRSPE